MTARRVILGTTSFADAQATLALAAGLAAQAGAELAGLLIEDEEMLALSAAPGACLIDPAGHKLAPGDGARMQAAFGRDAARFEEVLRAAAGPAALAWSFARRRGRLAPLLSDSAAPGDLLVVPAGPVRARLREVVLLEAGADPRLAAAATATAAQLGQPLRTLPAPGPAEDMLRLIGALGPGTVLFAGLAMPELKLAKLLHRTACTHVLSPAG